jgi:hypothetical protein
VLTPQEAALRGRIGAYAQKAAGYDPVELTANARAAFRSKFERQVDPDGTLPQEERGRRAEYARRAHFARLALASARARLKARGKKKSGAGAVSDAPNSRPDRRPNDTTPEHKYHQNVTPDEELTDEDRQQLTEQNIQPRTGAGGSIVWPTGELEPGVEDDEALE